MTYFIGHQSALELLVWENSWSSPFNRGFLDKSNLTKSSPTHGTKPSRNLIDSVQLPTKLRGSLPVHLFIGSESHRSRSKILNCHVWKGPDWGSFLRINNEFCVSSPEACFIQMSSVLPIEHLIELGYLLCGSYAPSSGEYGATAGLVPLASVASLTRYVNRCSGIDGVEKARRALRYVSDNSASVMETKLTMLLCLPQALGGAGIPLPELNTELNLATSRNGNRANVRRPDLFWPRQMVALEYDSAAYHSKEYEIARDTQRKNELISHGIKCLIARQRDVYGNADFDKLAGELKRLLGCRPRITTKGYPSKTLNLKRRLIGAGCWRFLQQQGHTRV